MVEVVDQGTASATNLCGVSSSSARVPAYLQIRSRVMARIERGEYLPGMAIPSENELAVEFDTTRLTIRNAIDGLVEQGIVRRIQGKGAYVTHQWDGASGALRGFREEIESADGVPTVRQLSKTKRLAGPYFAHIFGIDEHDALYSIRRLNSVNGEPVSIEETLIPIALFNDIENIDISVYSLYEIYEMRGHKVTRAQEKLDVVALSAREAGLLRVEPGSLALSLECLSYDANDRVIEHAYAVNRGDRGGYTYSY